MSNPIAPIARRGLMYVLSSPSGAGKTTLSRRLLSDGGHIRMSVSVTTRAKRPGEIDGQDYHFVDRPTFDRMVANDELLEHAEVFGHCYGTPRAFVEQTLASGHDVLFDIDWQGTHQLAEKARADLVAVFLLPPSMPELERRLVARAQDSAETVARRMKKAADEISHWQEYDYVVLNEDLDHALATLRAILRAERVRRQRQPGLAAFVDALCAERSETSSL